MLERIIRASVARPLLVVLLVLTCAGLGTNAFLELQRDVFPDLTAPVFSVIVQNPALDPEELEARVAIPLENALAGLPGIAKLRSSNQLGVSQLTLEFEPDTDFTRARQYVTEGVQQAAAQLPPGTGAPLISSLSGRLNEVMELTLEAAPGSIDLMTLRDLAEFDVANRLLAVPGVAAVERLGGYLRQFQVQLDPARMVARGISLDQVLHSVEGASVSASGGIITQGPMEWTVRAEGRAQSAAEVASVVVGLQGSTPVLVSDVADVREAPALRRGLAHRLDGEIISCRVVKQAGADTQRVSTEVRRAIEELTAGMPPGVRLRVAYDQADLIKTALGGVGRAILIGGALIVLVLFVLLGHLRAALLVTLSLPLSMALAALLLKGASIGLNTMTLGGLAIAVGLLVDAAIIVVENIVHRVRAAPSAAEAGSSLASRVAVAACEVGKPIAFATLVLVSVFVPLLGLGGLEGRMIKPLASAVVLSLLAGLLLALTFVPAAAGLLLRSRRASNDAAADNVEQEDDVWLLRQIKRAYAPALDWCTRRSGWVRVLALSVTVPAFWGATQLGQDFMPKIDEGALLLQTVLPPEASLEQVDLLNHRVEDALRGFDEVEDVVRRTGRSERTLDPMPHTVSDVLVVLRPERTESIEALTVKMRHTLSRVPGVSVLFTTPLGMRIDEGLGGTPADISVRVFGPDLSQLGTLAEQVEQIASEVPGLDDLRREPSVALPKLSITVDRAMLARVGLTPGDVVRNVRIALTGEEVGQIWRGNRRFDLVVRLPDDARNNAAAIGNLLVDGHDGTRIPLAQLAQVQPSFGPGVIRREAGSRRIAIDASVVGRDLAGAARELELALQRELVLPAGYFVDVGGKVEQQQQAERALWLAIGTAVLLVFLLVYIALGSALEALVIGLSLPDAFVGAIIALWLAGETWNVSSLIGCLGLLGIAVQNGLVLITQTQRLVAGGQPFAAALREASIGRVRPKLMTALTAILALLPILVLDLPGTEIERPLAIVMIGGLISSSLFTLFALPSFYSLVHRFVPKAGSSRMAE